MEEKSQNADEGGKPLLPHINLTLKESEIINFYNAMSKKIYPLDGHFYTIDDETKKFKEITINESDVPQETIDKLNKYLSPEFIIKHDNYEILTTPHITDKIIEIIEKAEKYCFLVTPYFDKWTHLERCLEDALKHKKKIVFFIRDEKFYDKNIRDFHINYKFDIIFIKNLHAKLYVNEQEALITSMNILKYSQENNYEIGVLIKNKNDLKEIVNKFIISSLFESGHLNLKTAKPLYLEGAYYKSLENGSFFEKGIQSEKVDNNGVQEQKLVNETSLLSNSNINDDVPKDEPSNTADSPNESSPSVVEKSNDPKGHCICCKEPITYNRDAPLCKQCTDNKNDNYKYCHKCGKEKHITYNRPECYSCFYGKTILTAG
jgi:hypothetical protein